jgi:hypothetical protein
MPSFGSGYRPDMTPPEKKPTLEEINAELLALVKGIVDTREKHFINNHLVATRNWDERALAAIARATAAQSD